MRFLQLDVIAYGSLENVSLSLSEGTQGLFVIYGRNEAGKSTTLRALGAALYGIPERTEDAFRFPYDKLRIGAKVRFDDGSELDFVRRKARRSALTTRDDAPLDDAPLRRALAGTDAEAFALEFGINQDRLREGGRALLEGSGDLAESLFSAGLGRAGVKAILAKLEAEADLLFKPRKSTSVVLSRLSEYDGFVRARESATASAREYTNTRETLERATKERDQASETRGHHERRLHELERLARIRPELAERRLLLERREATKGAVVLSVDFGARRREAEDLVRAAKVEVARASLAAATHEAGLCELPTDDALLEQAPRIEEHVAELVPYSKDLRELPALERERDTHRATAARALREAGLDPLTTLAALPTERIVAHARTLAADYGKLSHSFETANEVVEATKRKLEAAERALLELPSADVDLEALCRLIDDVKTEGKIDQEFAASRTALEEAEDEAAALQRKLRIGDTANEPRAPWHLPSYGDIEALVERGIELDQERRALEKEQQELVAERQTTERKYRIVVDRNRAPSEQDLSIARSAREELWGVVKGAWRDKENVERKLEQLGVKGAIADAYEGAVALADGVSDRLRTEAAAAQKRVALEEEMAQADGRIAEMARELEAREREKATWEREWAKSWEPSEVAPASPKRMLTWLRDAEALMVATRNVRAAQKRLGAVEKRVESAAQRLSSLLGTRVREAAKVAKVATLLAEATVVRDQAQKTEEQRRELVRDVKHGHAAQQASRVAAEQAAEARLRFAPRYEEALLPLALSPDARVAEVEQVVQRLSDARRELEAAARCDSDALATRERIERWEARGAELLLRVADDLGAESAEAAARTLSARLKAAQRASDKRTSLVALRDDERKKQRDAEALALAGTLRLEELCKEARVPTVEDLGEAERQSTERRAVEEALAALETKLVRGAAHTCDELEALARATTEDDDGAEHRRRKEAISLLDATCSALSERIGECKKSLALTLGDDVAARAAEDAEAAVAAIEAAIPVYLRARFAHVLLRRRLQKYREENAAPILTRASALFGQLTCGSFGGVDIEDDDPPRLVGVRKAGADRVTVDKMSEGTRDQLFLALRIASLEQGLAAGRRLPFVVDDVLVNFDDERAKVTLRLLSELATKTQVLFFTHHHRLVETAEALGVPDVFVREL